MGRATIVANLGDGRYRVQIDYGEQERLAALAELAEKIAALAEKITAQQALVAQADAAEAQQRAVVAMRFDAVIAAQPDGPRAPSAQYQAALESYAEAVRALAKLESDHEPIRRTLRTLKDTRSAAQRRQRELSYLVTRVERDAWCVTYTTDGAGEVAVHEIPGELPLIVIAPACRAPIEADGRLLARELMSPEQAFFNVAVLPGWQAFMPTYRWGTIDAIDWDANTCALTLGAASSSAQGLDVNAAGEVFMDVPITYLTCHARAFSLGDRVVVQFAGGHWSTPRVIGFLDNPQPCPPQAAGPVMIPMCATLQRIDVFAGLMLFATYPPEFTTIVGKAPLRFEIVSGGLPPGFSFDPDTSRVLGQAMDPGTWSCTVRCTDAGYNGGNRRYAEQVLSFVFEQTYTISDADVGTIYHVGNDLSDRWLFYPYGVNAGDALQTGVACVYDKKFEPSGNLTLMDTGVIASVDVGFPKPPCQRAFKTLVEWSATSTQDDAGTMLWFASGGGAPPPSGSVVPGIFEFAFTVQMTDRSEERR